MLPKRYASTKNKDRIRKEDEELIQKEFLRKKHKLSYLGMPSGEMKDILAWQNYFDRYTAVEIAESQRHALLLNAFKSKLTDKIELLYGDIEQILIKGHDNYGNSLEFPYDVVFLDLFGSIIYKEFNRVKAIKALINRQRGYPFLLLLTFNLRERRFCKNIILTVLRKIQDELKGFYTQDDLKSKAVEKIINWYKSQTTSEMYRQKLFVPYLIKTTCEEMGFKTHSYSPVFYKGFNKSPMIHFAFKLIPETDSPTKAISEQTLIDIINLNLKESSKGKVFVKAVQAPNLNI